ncbi:hypothetical protein [Streptomyces sp. NBC_01465]|uniref:hypothetical protein n=1 Tax=Streptomyces sp. NBC_01465 TaxID=2903878 RepID=UPI002E34CC9D|nr:hypothetical protein [Streptomyces sp. NBC_01465]
MPLIDKVTTTGSHLSELLHNLAEDKINALTTGAATAFCRPHTRGCATHRRS